MCKEELVNEGEFKDTPQTQEPDEDWYTGENLDNQEPTGSQRGQEVEGHLGKADLTYLQKGIRLGNLILTRLRELFLVAYTSFIRFSRPIKPSKAISMGL